MSDPPSGFAAFIAELKRRRVFRVAVVYAGVAFIIIQIIDGAFSYLRIPEWIGTTIIVLLLIGFPIAVALAWAFDITEEGLVRTKSKRDPTAAKAPHHPLVGNKTLALIAVLAIVFGVWSWWQRGEAGPQADFEHSIAVMPFENLTGDETYDVWEKGMATLLITALSTSKELYVEDSQTIFDLITSIEQAQKAQVIPSLVKEVAARIKVKTLVLGDILKAGERLRLQVRLLDTGSSEVVFSDFVEGDTEDDFFALAQALSDRVKDELEIKVLKQDIAYDLREPITTTSAAAYRHYVRGLGAFYDRDYQEMVKQLTRAVTIDSLFTEAHLKLAYGYGFIGEPEEARHHAGIAYSQKDRVPYEYQLRLEELREDFAKNPRGRVKWLKQLLALNPNRRWQWQDLCGAYRDLGQYDQAAEAGEKAMELGFQWGDGWKMSGVYTRLGRTYHELGEHDREVEVYEIGLEVLPDHPSILRYLASEYLFQGDTARAAPYLTRWQHKREEQGWSPSQIVENLGDIYKYAELWDQAEGHYRQAIALDPDNAEALNDLAYLLIDQERDVDEGLELAQRALQLVPEEQPGYANAYSLHALGWGYYKQGRYAEAVEALQKADERVPVYSWLFRPHLEQARAALAREK